VYSNFLAAWTNQMMAVSVEHVPNIHKSLV
jgi:hypothetical protein